MHPGELPIEYSRRPRLAARFQAILIVVMFASFLLILQQQAALSDWPSPPGARCLLQIAFGNIPPSTGFVKSMGLLLLTWGIVAALIVVAVQITPYLIQLGR